MRKVLLILLIIAFLVFSGFVIYQGTSIGKFNVWGIKQIAAKDEEINLANKDLETVTNTTFPNTLTKLGTSSETLQETKKEYEQKALLLSQNRYYKYKEEYKHEYIFVKIGNYAEDNHVDIRLVVTESTVAGLYDLNFTLVGKYIDVANFIYDIENDSTLGYKIENFIEVAASNSVRSTNYDDSGTKNNEQGNQEDSETQTEETSETTNTTQTTTSSASPLNYTVDEVKANFYCREVTIDLKWLDENESVIPGIITRGNPFGGTLTKDHGGSGTTNTRTTDRTTSEIPDDTSLPASTVTPTVSPTPVTSPTPSTSVSPTPEIEPTPDIESAPPET